MKKFAMLLVCCVHINMYEFLIMALGASCKQ